MTRKKRSTKWLARLLAVSTAISLLTPAACNVRAVTDLSQDDFERIVSRYTASKNAVAYEEYALAYPQVFPENTVEVDGDRYVRYEENDAAAEPEILTDFEGMAGNKMLMLKQDIAQLRQRLAEVEDEETKKSIRRELMDKETYYNILADRQRVNF